MKLTNPKHLLFDFYLAILKLDPKFRAQHPFLYVNVRRAIAKEIGESEDIVQRIFEAMAKEDEK